MNKPGIPPLIIASVFFAVLTVTPTSKADTYTWTNTAGGNWNSALNWSPNQVPGGSDTAMFSTSGTYTVLITDNESVSNLALGAGSGTETLNIPSGTFTVNGAGTDSAQSVLNLSGGTITGSGSIMLGGPLNWTGGNIYALLQCGGGSVNVSIASTVGYGGQLINTGPMTWTANSGPRTGGNNSGAPIQTVISNASTGVLSLILVNGNNIESYAYGGATAFYNAGQIDVSGPGQGSTITDPFINTGTVTITNGALLVSGGGNNSGLISVESAGTFVPNGGTFSSGSTISGAGSLDVNGGTANLGGTINLTGAWTFSGGTANLTGSSSVTSAAVTNNGGNANFNGAGPWLTGSVAISSGSFGGTTTLVSSGPLYWTGGNIYGLLQCGGGSVNVSIASTVGYGGQLINTGPMTWTANSGPRTGGNNSGAAMQTVISNASTGVLSLILVNGNNIESYAYGGATAFYNAGQIDVSGPGQGSTITDPFINTGTVTITNGALLVSGGGNNSGLISVESAGTFVPNGGTFSSGSTISGAGSLDVNGGTANLGGTINLTGAWTFSGGTANLTGSSSVTSAAVTNNGGNANFNGAGPWLTGSVAISSGSFGGTTTLVSSGPLYWTGGNIYGLLQCGGGSVNVSIASTVGYGGQLINTGPMTWTANSGPRTGGNNSGAAMQTVISNASTGVLSLILVNGNNIESYAYGGATAFYNAGQIDVSGPGQGSTITDPFINTGTVTITNGALLVSGGGNNSGLISVESAGTFVPNGGTFSSGSTISGAGSLDVNGGTANLGGTINLTGAWTFSGGTANLTGSSSVTSAAVTNNGGNANFNGAGPWLTGSVAISSGSFGGTTTLVSSGPLYWTGGNIYGLLQCGGGSVNVSIASTVGYGGQLINTGPMTWTANSGPRTGGNNSGAPIQTVISNAGTGVLSLILVNGNNIESYAYGGATAFYNAGQIDVSGPGQGSTITDPFINTGTVTITNGALLVSGGGNNSGLISVESAGTFVPNGGTFSSGSTISGAGSLDVNGGTANLGGTINLTGAWTFSGGTANLTGSSSVTSAAVTNNGGNANFNGAGPWLTGSVAISSGSFGGTTTLVSSGPLYWTGGNIFGLLQCGGGSVNVSIASTVGYGGQLINTGPMTWTANSGPRTGGNNSGAPIQTVISNASTGVLSLILVNGNNIESYAYGGATAFYNAGQINVSGTGQTGAITDPLINSGTLNIQSGELSTTGGFTSRNGTLSFGINSTNSFGSLASSGYFAMNGTLDAIANGYAPKKGDAFPLITYGSQSGIFNAFNLPPAANWQPKYGQTVFSLVVSSLTAPYVTLEAVLPVQITDGFPLLMLGPIGSNYLIQAASESDLTNWVTLTNFTTVDTSFYYTDVSATNYSDRIYRAVLQE